jgi:hypothetical protein
MAGFIRRFGFFPGNEVIRQIEGVAIVDLPPPGSVQGVSTGVTALVGEFADMTYATTVNGSGVVTTLNNPQEVFTAQDMIDKFGGFDETFGDFGADSGNGFVAVRNKRYARLVLSAVNLASATGVRYTRALPLSTTQTNTLPIVPVQGATIVAGREFRGPLGGRLRIAKRVNFTALAPIAVGVAGAIAAAAAAAVQTFTVAGADFSAILRPDGGNGIKKGDIIVIGNNNAGALQPLPAGGSLGAGTYRVATDALVGSPTVLSLEQLTGGNFAFVTATTIPWRIHVSSDADSAPVIVLGSSVAGGYAATDLGGFSIPARPLTNETGGLTDGVWTAAALLTPREAPPALTGATWEQLAGLAGQIITAGGLTFTAALQRSNAVQSAAMDALYTGAIDSLVSEQTPMSEISIVFSARTSLAIRSKLKAHVLDASARADGRVAVIRPALTVQDTTSVVSTTDPGVGANRDERVIYSWPGARTFIPEAVGFRLKLANGLTTTDGTLDVGADGFLASVMSNLPPERNPGQSSPPVPELLAAVLGLQNGVPRLELNDYIVLRSNGVAALKIDRTVGPLYQSGITTSLISGQTNISRRRMADFIQDSLSQRLVQFVKLPLTQANKDNMLAEADAFMRELRSEDNPAAQRILDYRLDDKSGNTPATEAQGIFVIILRVRLIASADFIVLQTEIGESVVIQPLAA